MVVRIADELDERLFAFRGLQMSVIAAGAHAETAELDSGFAQRHLIDGCAFGCRSRGPKGVADRPGRKERRARHSG